MRYFDADKVLNHLSKKYPTGDTYPILKCELLSYMIDPVKYAHWTEGCICSSCGYEAEQTEWEYCGHCGAKMDEVDK